MKKLCSIMVLFALILFSGCRDKEREFYIPREDQCYDTLKVDSELK